MTRQPGPAPVEENPPDESADPDPFFCDRFMRTCANCGRGLTNDRARCLPVPGESYFSGGAA